MPGSRQTSVPELPSQLHGKGGRTICTMRTTEIQQGRSHSPGGDTGEHGRLPASSSRWILIEPSFGKLVQEKCGLSCLLMRGHSWPLPHSCTWIHHACDPLVDSHTGPTLWHGGPLALRLPPCGILWVVPDLTESPVEEGAQMGWPFFFFAQPEEGSQCTQKENVSVDTLSLTSKSLKISATSQAN